MIKHEKHLLGNEQECLLQILSLSQLEGHSQ